MAWNTPDYQDLYGTDLTKQVNISRILKKDSAKGGTSPLPKVVQVIRVLWFAVICIADLEINIYICTGSGPC